MSRARRCIAFWTSLFPAVVLLMASVPPARAVLGGGKGGGIGGILGTTQVNHALAGTGITFGRVTDDNPPPLSAEAIRVRPGSGVRDANGVIPVTTIRVAMLSERGAMPWGTFIGRLGGDGTLTWEIHLASLPADGLLFGFGDRKYWLTGDPCGLTLGEDPAASIGRFVVTAVDGLDDDCNGAADFERADRMVRDHGVRILGDQWNDGCEVNLTLLPDVQAPPHDSIGTVMLFHQAIQEGDAALQAQLERDPDGNAVQAARIDVVSMPAGGVRIVMGDQAWRMDAAADALVLVPLP